MNCIAVDIQSTQPFMNSMFNVVSWSYQYITFGEVGTRQCFFHSLFLQTNFIKWEQNHRAPSTYINDNYTNIIKTIKMASNSMKEADKKKQLLENKKIIFEKNKWKMQAETNIYRTKQWQPTNNI